MNIEWNMDECMYNMLKHTMKYHPDINEQFCCIKFNNTSIAFIQLNDETKSEPHAVVTFDIYINGYTGEGHLEDGTPYGFFGSDDLFTKETMPATLDDFKTLVTNKLIEHAKTCLEFQKELKTVMILR